MRRKMFVPALAAAAVICAFAAASLRAQDAKHANEPTKMAVGPTKAVTVLHATKSGGEASGTVTFTKAEGGVRVVALIKGLAPGEHGFHIHEFGDVSTPDAMSAGGHFNPGMAPHGAPTAGMRRHVGDLGNITADARGTAKVDFVDPLLSFTGPFSIIGHSVIVHEKPDDLKTQPTGNAGARVAAGVIGIGKP
jgi:superoxide dismutase, Cu-Zn family